MRDSWYTPFWNGEKWIYGGAARNARIDLAGGVEKICCDVAADAARQGLMRVESATTAAQRSSNVVALRRAA